MYFECDNDGMEASNIFSVLTSLNKTISYKSAKGTDQSIDRLSWAKLEWG